MAPSSRGLQSKKSEVVGKQNTPGNLQTDNLMPLGLHSRKQFFISKMKTFHEILISWGARHQCSITLFHHGHLILTKATSCSSYLNFSGWGRTWPGVVQRPSPSPRLEQRWAEREGFLKVSWRLLQLVFSGHCSSHTWAWAHYAFEKCLFLWFMHVRDHALDIYFNNEFWNLFILFSCVSEH